LCVNTINYYYDPGSTEEVRQANPTKGEGMCFLSLFNRQSFFALVFFIVQHTLMAFGKAICQSCFAVFSIFLSSGVAHRLCVGL
jgi:hypothetical protein